MHPSLRNYLPVEMGELFQVPYILKKHRSALSCRQYILVVGHWCTDICGQLLILFFIWHNYSLLRFNPFAPEQIAGSIGPQPRSS